MKIEKTKLENLFIIHPRIFEDHRGYFFESYNQQRFREQHLTCQFVQDNESLSSYGTIRGLHYQLEPRAQAKLVRVICGKIFDVAVDLREGSETFGQWHGTELSDHNKKQMLIPKGFAHGFSVLSDSAIVFYKCDEFYAPDYERGIHFKDPKINIDWKVRLNQAIVSDKDQALPHLHTADKNTSIA